MTTFDNEGCGGSPSRAEPHISAAFFRRLIVSPFRSSRTLRPRIILAFLITAIGLLAASGLKAVEVTEPQMKAAFLLNFPKYIDWPEGTFATTNSPLVMAFFGTSEVAAEFQKMAQGKSVCGRPIEFKRLTTQEESWGKVHVVFVGTADSREVSAILARIRDASVLTVGQSEEFVEKGGMINLTPRDRKIRLDINLRAARQVDLKISSKLLSVADNVKGR